MFDKPHLLEVPTDSPLIYRTKIGLKTLSFRQENKMLEKALILGLTLGLAVVLAQEKPRLGSDGRPLLNKPILEKCMNRDLYFIKLCKKFKYLAPFFKKQ